MTFSNQSICQKCGKCCALKIGVTLLDVKRLARYLQKDPADIFQDYLGEQIEPESGLLLLRKNPATATCMFLDEQNLCGIHDAKPGVCRLYICDRSLPENRPFHSGLSLQENVSDPADWPFLWEQRLAVEITRVYTQRHGATLIEDEYLSALETIAHYTLTRNSQKLKLARDCNGHPIAQLSDCETCPVRGCFAKHTPVTLDDMKMIAEELKIGWGELFSGYIAPEADPETGTFQLLRELRCVLSDPETQCCSIPDAKPRHCRFTPCPKETKDDDLFNRFFLGSSTLEEQFRHQVALAYTRDYVQDYGFTYNRQGIRKHLRMIEEYSADENSFRLFCNSIRSYRYLDDSEISLKRFHSEKQ